MINNFSPLLKSAFLLCSGLFIFGFADNFIILISDKVSVGQFHFSRSLVACLAVIVIAYYFKESLIPTNLKRSPIINAKVILVTPILFINNCMPQAVARLLVG